MDHGLSYRRFEARVSTPTSRGYPPGAGPVLGN